MKRAIALSGAVFAAAAAFVVAAPNREEGLYSSRGPVTEDQVRQKLASNGRTAFKWRGADGLSWQWRPRKGERTRSRSLQDRTAASG